MVIRRCGHWRAKTVLPNLFYLYSCPSYWMIVSKQAKLQFL